MTTVNEWKGISPARFYPYRNIVTKSGYLCGTSAATTFLCYYQDYLVPTIIPPHIRQQGSEKTAALQDLLRVIIQPFDFPTLSLQVAHGMSRYFTLFQLPFRARQTPIGGISRVTKRIDEGKPVIVGLMKLKGSTYGNHWVVAYAYKKDAMGNYWLKVHDNWGDYQKVIPASWINGTISLP
ncbi:MULTISPECIES: hypothetical protein [Enterococcus]|jgi:hypothetical protein|uniref:Peptidase C39-like domain-containing protein n=1 Tax=Enterococcus dispar ATCC 51266 TaxID=1139219 RepID=S0KLG7_9ENTE|nr:hypothetical protein [Enterococcus dispar]EOT40863.1 hypothetical protein OMK_01779 [Enterococcus dispar ATCC 51266]EOW86764.1 hypothetical protein I569_02127 [Enterococcus dispar ATCC 51266]MCU7357678.1 hypothetical protein [Enterococcus dispar]MDT2706315.1 hypothetical protein [Enterococcus dispar]OJG39706.1 hypothetical protein RV01_GL000888 [Enterococcus dispar]